MKLSEMKQILRQNQIQLNYNGQPLPEDTVESARAADAMAGRDEAPL